MSRFHQASRGKSNRRESVHIGSRKPCGIRTGRLALAAAAAAVSLLNHSADATSATWTSTAASGSWSVSTNWGGSNIPGASGNTTNADTATFNGNATVAVGVDANRILQNITFDTAAGNFTLGGGNLSMTSGGTIQLASSVTSMGKIETINTPITLEGNYTFANNGNTTDVLSFGSSATVTSAATSGITTLTLSGSNTGNNVIDGIISDGTGSNTVSVAKTGAGTWVLGAANTYSGSSTINQGTLTLDFTQGSAPATNIISSSSSLMMGGGAGSATLNVIGAANATNSQTFAGTTFNQGASSFTINNNASSNPTLVSLGNLTRSVGGTVNFTQPVNGIVGSTNGYVTGTSNISGILGGWATVGGNDWASNNGANIVAYTGYTSSSGATNPPSGWASGQNISIDGNLSGTLTAGTVVAPGLTTINSLRFNNSATTTLNPGTANFGINGFSSGATVFTPTSGSTTGLYLGELINLGGTLPAGDYITSLTASTFTLASQATANQNAGATFTATTSQLSVSSGGILETNNVGAVVSTISAGELLGPANGDLVINQNNGTASTSGLVIASAINNNGTSPTGLTKTGAGYLTLTGFGSTFSGPVSVNAGTLEIDGPLAIGATYVAAGAVLTQTPVSGGTVENLTIGTLTGAGTVKYQSPVSPGVFTVNESASSSFNGQITDATTVSSLASVAKNGGGTLTLTGAAGALTEYRGLTVNAGGFTFSGGATIVLPISGNARNPLTVNQGAVVTLDDTTTNVGNRTGTVNNAFTLSGGAFNLLGSSSATTVETIPTTGTSPITTGVIMGAGSDIINATAGTGFGTTLSFGSTYARNAGSTALFEGMSLGTAVAGTANVTDIKISTSPTLTGAGSAGTPSFGVMAGTFVDNVTSGPTNNYSIAAYGTNGVRALASGETIGTLTAGDNVLATSALTNNGATINSLTLGSGGSIDSTAGTLIVTSGTILSTGSSTSIGSGGGNTLQSGNTASSELVIYNAPSTALTIGSTISGNAGLTVGGAGTTILTANNSGLTGPITVNGGILSISAANNLGTSTNTIALNNGGELQSTGSAVTLGSGNITVGGTTANTITSGDIDVSGSASNTLTQGTGKVVGVGTLTKSGIGILVLNTSNSYGGGTTIAGGTLRTANVNALGGGAVAISGGTLALGTDASTVGSLTTGAETWNSGGYTAKITNANGNASSVDQVTMSGLTVMSTNASPFAITLTAPLATTGFNSASNYDWQIAKINAASVSGISTGSILAEADSSGQNISSGFGSEIFTLDTSSFVTANSPPSGSFYFLELEGTSGAYTLDVGYNSAPEPGTAMLILAGAMPMLSSRRRRRKVLQPAQ